MTRKRRLELMKKASESKLAKRMGKIRSLFVLDGGHGSGTEHGSGKSQRLHRAGRDS